MEIQLRLVAGLLCSIAMVKNQNTGTKTECKVINLKADCTSRNLISIPTNLDMKITDLDVSFNPIESVAEDDFKRYRSLTTLRLYGLNPKTNSTKYAANMLAPLLELNNLDMSESPFEVTAHFGSGLVIHLPKKIKFFSIANLKYYQLGNENLNLSSLADLKELNISYHGLQKLPDLHPLTSIYWIDLYKNPLRDLTAESLAPLCTLVFLRLGLTGITGLESSVQDMACQCHRVEQWMLKFHIRGFGSTCTPTSEGTCPNKKNFSEIMLSQRKACLDRQPSLGLWKWLILLALISLLLPAAYVGNEYYKRYKRRKGTDDSSGAAPATAPENEAAPPEGGETPVSNPEP